MRPMVVVCFASLLIVPAAFAQSFTTAPCSSNGDGGSHHSWSSGSQERACESRRATLPLAGGELHVIGKNGGIELVGEDRNDVALEAQVIAQASSREDAERLVHEVRVETDGTIRAEGPKTGNWSVNFKLRVPRHLAAELKTENGGINLANLDGTVRAQTTNGGISLSDLGGDALLGRAGADQFRQHLGEIGSQSFTGVSSHHLVLKLRFLRRLFGPLVYPPFRLGHDNGQDLIER